MAEADDDASALRERPSGIHLSTTFEGRLALDGDFEPAGSAVITAALRDFDVPDAVDDNGAPIGPVRTPGQRRADALVALARFGIDHRDGAGATGRFLPPRVAHGRSSRAAGCVTAGGAGIATLADLESFADDRGLGEIEWAWFTDALARHGESWSFDDIGFDAVATTLFSCDSIVQRVLTIGSKVIDMGREVRTAPPHLRRAVITRDRHCRAPGCRREARFCEVRLVDHWIHGGETDCGRLVLLCSFHHHQFHRPGWSMTLADDAVLEVRAPDGRARRTHPPGHGPPLFAPSVR